ncbi:hypothetical protein GGU11DRAFT_231804 [Lentinula aff. detonsa]|uniref:Uncharacterized protein n=1 Tax=Lentinula aff. detonsa TaxID=2804958 RepID=A0AA38KEQ9_9AGAR|nr:hypothetical protein GGU10DRAFT_60968 [Lentinula aff. detonsa]KAJ3795387.1 hypothetical protein GGU11DRAFT_231804 [Lentinula aff. detonsa]
MERRSHSFDPKTKSVGVKKGKERNPRDEDEKVPLAPSSQKQSPFELHAIIILYMWPSSEQTGDHQAQLTCAFGYSWVYSPSSLFWLRSLTIALSTHITLAQTIRDWARRCTRYIRLSFCLYSFVFLLLFLILPFLIILQNSFNISLSSLYDSFVVCSFCLLLIFMILILLLYPRFLLSSYVGLPSSISLRYTK